MKRMISNIVLFVFTLTVVFCVYRGLFKISAATICLLLIILALYAFCMDLSWKSMKQLQKYEKKAIHFSLDKNDGSKVLLFSLLSLSPAYFCVFLVSLLPLYINGLWLITVFPCVLANCIPASSVGEEYFELMHQKRPFFVCFLMLILAFLLIGIVVSSVVLKKYVA